MAIIKPMRAYRYHDRFARQMGKIICPPYDVISSAVEKVLLKRHPYNAIRIELPRPAAGYDKYRHAARVLNRWMDTRILIQDTQESLYLYEQYFTIDRRRYCRRGFFAAVKIEKPRTGAVVPHEKTLSKPKTDRLRLLKALRVNTSPIFGFFSDAGSTVRTLLRRESRGTSLIDVSDDAGVRHRLRSMVDRHTIRSIQYALLHKNIFIADGHHRYETSWNYLQSALAKEQFTEETAYVMMYLCPLEDPGLIILPTHRAVIPGPKLNGEILIKRAQKYFMIRSVASPAQVGAAMERTNKRHIIGVCSRSGNMLLELKNDTIMGMRYSAASPAYRRLDVVILHALLLTGIDPAHIRYIKGKTDAIKAAEESGALVFLLKPPSLQEVRRVSLAGQTMPQKTTFFYPKLGTGLVMHSLRRETS